MAATTKFIWLILVMMLPPFQAFNQSTQKSKSAGLSTFLKEKFDTKLITQLQVSNNTKNGKFQTTCHSCERRNP